MSETTKALGDVLMNTDVHALFLVGRISKGERRLIFVQAPAQAPIPGPWELRAIFAN